MEYIDSIKKFDGVDMTSTDPLSLDIAALNTLRVVYRSRSFTEAAEQLGVNQSAVSYTIERLRKVFHDQLFVREGGKQVATPRCEELVVATNRILDEIQDLSRPQGFDPKEANEKIRIACNYYERVLLVPAIVNAIRNQAPNLKLEIVDARGFGHVQLLDLKADLLIGPFARKEAGFYSRNLIAESYVCMVASDHPFASKAPKLADYIAAEHIYISYGGGWRSAYLSELEARNIELPVALSVPSPAGIEKLIHGTKLVATIPKLLAQSIAGELAIQDCPVRGEFDIELIWTGRTHSSEMFKWLRETIAQTVRALGY